MHHTEKDKSTNTVRLLTLAVPSAKIILIGQPDERPDFSGMIHPGTTPLLLYPEPTAPVLDSTFMEKLSGDVTLIVPDGTWKQARKLTHHLEELRGIRRVQLAGGSPSRYLLRRNQRPGSVCTIEAIARALGVLDGADVQHALEKYLDLMVERVLWTRRTSQIYADTCVGIRLGADR